VFDTELVASEVAHDQYSSQGCRIRPRIGITAADLRVAVAESYKCEHWQKRKDRSSQVSSLTDWFPGFSVE
jgi:hypothetical protein